MTPEQEERIRRIADVKHQAYEDWAALAQVVLEVEQRTATLRLTDTGPDPIGPWAEPLATASPLQTASATNSGIDDDGLLAVNANANSGKIDVGLATPKSMGEILMRADIFSPYLDLQPGQRIHLGRGLVVRVTEPERNDTEGKDRDKEPETLDIRDTQSRVRVRDELASIINNGLPPNLYGAQDKVDRILDRLQLHAHSFGAAPNEAAFNWLAELK